MPNGLYIRSYPARGAQIVPATYGGDVKALILVILLLGLIVWAFGPKAIEESHWIILALCVYALASIVFLCFLASQELEIRSDGISYKSLFHKNQFVAFREISTVMYLTDPHYRGPHGLISWAGLTRLAGTLIVTPNAETGKSSLKIPLLFIQDAAEGQLRQTLKPEECDIEDY
jgi:hypothetical protein